MTIPLLLQLPNSLGRLVEWWRFLLPFLQMTTIQKDLKDAKAAVKKAEGELDVARDIFYHYNDENSLGLTREEWKQEVTRCSQVLHDAQEALKGLQTERNALLAQAVAGNFLLLP